MSDQATLDRLPAELLELCVNLLDLDDIRNLRLANVEVAAKVSKGYFRTCFVNGRLCINDKRQLATFAKVTQAGRMGTLLRDLTVVTVVHTQGRVAETHPLEELELLSQAFSNLRRYSTWQSLRSLKLTAESKDENGESISIRAALCPPFMSKVKGIDRGRVWTATASIWHAIASALSNSDLSIGKLDVFGDTSQCSIAIDEFAAGVRMYSFPASLAKLHHLTLHISHHMTDKCEAVEKRYPIARSELSTRTLRQFLELCPSMESLDLRWLNFASWDVSDALNEEENFVSRISSRIQLPILRSLSLHHLRVPADVLLTLLQSIPLERLNLEYVILGPGTYRGVFDYLSIAQLKHLSLSFLRDDRGSLSFIADGMDAFEGPRELMRCGEEDTSKPIRYKSTRSKAPARRMPAPGPCTCPMPPAQI